jgi:isoleucyl-tRNA synthetase
LNNLTYYHPIYHDQIEYPFVTSDHVTGDVGTGLVHIAPAHGSDDFLLSIKYKLRCVNAVDLTGRLHCPNIASLHGRLALDSTDGISSILEYLQSNVVHHYPLTHSYPYDWRTKTPVIILASQQWFIDTMQLRDDARQCIVNDVTIFPEGAGKSFLSMTGQRPYWCISRQRYWGVPIPVFYTKDDRKQVIINDNIIEHIIQSIDKHGSIDFWWSANDIRELLPTSMHNQADGLQRSDDIFDVWFDSGSSFNTILKRMSNARDSQ